VLHGPGSVCLECPREVVVVSQVASFQRSPLDRPLMTAFEVAERHRHGGVSRSIGYWRDEAAGLQTAVERQDELVEIMHVNGRLMPGYQPMRVAPETRALARAITRSATPKEQSVLTDE
jgi:hypothetical protein